MQSLAQNLRNSSSKIVCVSVSAALLWFANPAKAILTINIYDDGPNLNVVTSGSLSALGTFVESNFCGVSGALLSAPAVICTGTDITSPIYSTTGPTSFGGTANILADSVSGLSFVFAPSSPVFTSPVYGIDPAYLPGQPFLSSATFNGTNLIAQGFTTQGLIGTWTIDGTSESINLFVGPPAEVPGPLPLLGAGAAFGWSRRMRRRITAPVSTPPQA